MVLFRIFLSHNSCSKSVSMAFFWRSTIPSSGMTATSSWSAQRPCCLCSPEEQEGNFHVLLCVPTMTFCITFISIHSERIMEISFWLLASQHEAILKALKKSVNLQASSKKFILGSANQLFQDSPTNLILLYRKWWIQYATVFSENHKCKSYEEYVWITSYASQISGARQTLTIAPRPRSQSLRHRVRPLKPCMSLVGSRVLLQPNGCVCSLSRSWSWPGS